MDASIESSDFGKHELILSLIRERYPEIEVVDVRAQMPMPGDDRCFEKLLSCLVTLKGEPEKPYRVTTLSPESVVHVFARYLHNMGRIDEGDWRVLCEVEQVGKRRAKQHLLVVDTDSTSPYASVTFQYRNLYATTDACLIWGEFRRFFDEYQELPPSP